MSLDLLYSFKLNLYLRSVFAYGNMNICIEPYIPELDYEQA